MGTINSIDMTISTSKGVSSNSAFKNSLIVGVLNQKEEGDYGIKNTVPIKPFIVTRDSFREDMVKAGFEEKSDEILMASCFFTQESSVNEVIVMRTDQKTDLELVLESIDLDFYSFAITVKDDEDLFLSASQYASSAHKRFIGLYTNPENIVKEFENSNAIFICHQDLTTRIDASYMGAFFGRPVGYNSKFIELNGETVNNFSTTQLKALQEKNVNWYQFEGFNYLYSGIASNGDFLDSLYIVDYCKNTINTDLLSLVRKNQRIPFDSTGESLLASSIRATLLSLAQDKGLLANVESSADVAEYSDNGKWGFILDPIKLVDASESDKVKKHALISMRLTPAGNLKSIETQMIVNL